MYLKLNLIVICAVLLNSSECKKCEDIWKCVFDWAVSALTADPKSKEDTIQFNTKLTEDPLKNLTQFLINNFTDVLSQGPYVKDVGIDTKIYVQTLKINESLIVSTAKSDTETYENNDDISDDADNLSIDFQNFTNDIITTNNSDKMTTSYYLDNVHHTPNINKKTLAEYKIKKNVMPLKLDITKKNNTNQTNTTISQNSTHVNNNNLEDERNMIEDEKTTTAAYFDKDKNNKEDNKNTQGNEIDAAYDFFGHNENDIGDLLHINLTDYLDVDYIELYKDTTNEDVGYTPATYIPTTSEAVKIISQKPANGIDFVYPWIATVFVMNSDGKQFEYICDGSLVSERVVLTAARCVISSNATVGVTNILVILGKRTLQGVGLNEKVLRVQSVKIHDNFTSAKGKVDNDLAVIVLAERVVFNVDIQPALLGIDDKFESLELATTGWHVSGPLVPLYLEQQTAEFCMEKTDSQNIICAVLGDNETTCSSFGGLLVDRQGGNQWGLRGIATGDPMTKGVCFDKELTFTKIGNYFDWISKNVLEAAASN